MPTSVQHCAVETAEPIGPAGGGVRVRRRRGRRPLDLSRAPDAVSVRMVCRIFGVTHITVRRWIRQRYIPAVRIGLQIRVRSHHIRQAQAALREARATGPTTERLYALRFKANILKHIQYSD